MEEDSYDFSTKLLHFGQEPEQWTSKAVIPPIVNSTTFKQIDPGNSDYEYSRSGNPTRRCLEKSFAACENAKYALAFASGLGASTAIAFLLRSGDHILASDDLYGGTFRLFDKCITRMNIKTDFIDFKNIEMVESSIKTNTKLIWIETPTNPLLTLCDIKKICEIAKAKNIITVVDNTFATPVFQQPLKLGADIVIHSVTKYLNGHSDVVMGCIMTNNDRLYNELKFLQNALGIVPSPFDCYLANRGIKTLCLRMKQHMENALHVAKFLETHEKVERTIYPFLPSHPQHELAKMQMSGFSGMISAFIKASDRNHLMRFVQALKVFTLAESLGGYESLVCLPVAMTHSSIDVEHREKVGLSFNLVRFSIGLENHESLINDLKHALDCL